MIQISLNESDLYNVIKKHVKNEDIARLLCDTLGSSHSGTEWLFKIHLGAKYPEVPAIGAHGYISIENYKGWSGDKDKYKDSMFNQQGYIPVIVKSFQGLHNYYPLRVLAPGAIDEQTGEAWNNEFAVDVKDFIPTDEFDLY